MQPLKGPVLKPERTKRRRCLCKASLGQVLGAPDALGGVRANLGAAREESLGSVGVGGSVEDHGDLQNR